MTRNILPHRKVARRPYFGNLVLRNMRKATSERLISIGGILLALALQSGCALLFGGKSKPTASVDDGALVARIHAMLAQDPIVKQAEVNVASAKGVVELTGYVGSMSIKSRAGLVAASTPGVVQVHNDLLVSAAPAH